MTHSSVSGASASENLQARALRLSRQIPNKPHPDRARAVHAWAAAMLRVLREGRS